jgi:hypothetical protein
MARQLTHLRRLLIIVAILILLVIIAKPSIRTFETLWYRIVERRERVVDRSPTTTSMPIDRTTVAYTSWGDGPVLLIWCDLVGNSGGGAGSSGDGVLTHGNTAAGGRRMDWRCDSADGRTGSVQINGVPYDLARGTFPSSARRGSGPEWTSSGAI